MSRLALCTCSNARLHPWFQCMNGRSGTESCQPGHLNQCVTYDCAATVSLDCMHLHAPAGPPVKHWKCQLALAATQTAFCIGSVYLKSSIRTASASRQFHPIIYAFAREAVAGPIMCSIAWFTSRECLNSVPANHA